MENKRTIGAVGEDAATAKYIELGYVPVAENWRYRKVGEIDRIFLSPDGSVLVFCEVKLRKNDDFDGGAAAVNYKKQMTIRMLAEHFLTENPYYSDKNVRFDVCEVYKNGDLTVNLIENAF